MKDHNQHEIQMSEAFLNSAFLALSGGFQDAYTYNARNEVFCNAQTGNVVLMSQHFMAGEVTAGLGYFFPIIFFALGVWVAEKIQANYKYAQKLHWRQGVLLAEILILFTVGFLPTEYNMLANAMASFACAMQVQSFRKVNGYSYASTMCIGNLRSGTAALSVYFREKIKTAGTGNVLFWNHSYVCTGCRHWRKPVHTLWNQNNLGILWIPYDQLPADVCRKI